MSKIPCGCHKPKCGCSGTIHTPTPFITQSTCNSGCETMHPANCVEENKWVSISEADYQGCDGLSANASNTPFKINRLKYRKTRSKLELLGIIEYPNNFTFTNSLQEFLFLNKNFLTKIGFYPFQNTLQLKYILLKDYDETDTNSNVFAAAFAHCGYLTFKNEGVYITAGYHTLLAGAKIIVNVVFDNNYDL